MLRIRGYAPHYCCYALLMRHAYALRFDTAACCLPPPPLMLRHALQRGHDDVTTMRRHAVLPCCHDAPLPPMPLLIPD